jgi:hypothetical protein
VTFNYLLKDSVAWTLFFFALLGIAVFTQLMKEKLSIPVFLRALIKAAPALFLSGLCFYLELRLVGAGWVLCASGVGGVDVPAGRGAGAVEVGGGGGGVALGGCAGGSEC